ncbi:hypothetical protein THAOC_17220 [Thalassiosira oceanica]|uniref:Uncharacterized protein n=1 Tax=Thalassiosira oceanica TaxID=159749 RepID=K0SMP9_THAOC|nr:hypothetical protein THAOC_17220 [Thalassiosira oceanica]|eukprot:EJK62181.1 hypothetical protein THAOC_17220 [Thalassiosira oceanica]
MASSMLTNPDPPPPPRPPPPIVVANSAASTQAPLMGGMTVIKQRIRARRAARKLAERQAKRIARLAPLIADLQQHFHRRAQDARSSQASRISAIRRAVAATHRLRVAVPRSLPRLQHTPVPPIRRNGAKHVYPRACIKPTAARPWPLAATDSPPSRSHVRFNDSVATVRVFDGTAPAAAIGPSLCADSGASKSLNRRSTATALGLPHAGPSDTFVRMASGQIKRAVSKTVLPFDITSDARAGEVLDDGDLADNLAAIKPLADSGHITIFHPGDEGVTVHRRDDVNLVILYAALPSLSHFLEDYHVWILMTSSNI